MAFIVIEHHQKKEKEDNKRHRNQWIKRWKLSDRRRGQKYQKEGCERDYQMRSIKKKTVITER